jgi:hypothetical protein
MGRVQDDPADDVVVEFPELLGRNPEFIDAGAADSLRWELPQVRRVHFEAQHVPDEARRRVLGGPVARDLGRVLLVKHRIEDGLADESWREASPAAVGKSAQARGR